MFFFVFATKELQNWPVSNSLFFCVHDVSVVGLGGMVRLFRGLVHSGKLVQSDPSLNVPDAVGLPVAFQRFLKIVDNVRLILTKIKSHIV